MDIVLGAFSGLLFALCLLALVLVLALRAIMRLQTALHETTVRLNEVTAHRDYLRFNGYLRDRKGQIRTVRHLENERH